MFDELTSSLLIACGIALICLGLAYVLNLDILQRSILTRMNIRWLTPEQNKALMPYFGAAQVAAGTFFLVIAYL